MEQHLQLGKYRIYHHLATGGMGEVFLARQEGPAGFAKNVVVKRIAQGVAEDPNFVQMFLNEARVAAMIEHPHVVQIFDLGLEGHTYFIAMEYVHGKSLRHVRNELSRQGRVMPPELAARICSQALQGLHYAHTLTDDDGTQLNIVHRDVSPDNVLIGFNGVVKVVDFGIASAAVTISTTRAGEVKGKSAYMAPEQLRSQKLDGRADVYGMGVLLYELLSGQRPFHATTEPGLIRAVLQDDLLPPSACNPSSPKSLDAVVLSAMSRDVNTRFSSAENMSLALEAYIQSTGKTVTNAHLAALMKDIFPEEATHKTPVPAAARAQYAASFGTGTPSSTSKPLETGFALLGEDVEYIVDLEPTAPKPRTKAKWLAVGLAVAGVVSGVALTIPRPAPPVEQTVVKAVSAPDELALAPVSMEMTEADDVLEALDAPRPDELRDAPLDVTAAAILPVKPAERTKVKKVAARKREEPKNVVAKAPVAEPEKEAAPLSTTGKVLLRVNPWAEVFFAGRSLGMTPLDAVELPAGTQVLTLRNDNLKLERRVSVNVVADREVVLKADLLE